MSLAAIRARLNTSMPCDQLSVGAARNPADLRFLLARVEQLTQAGGPLLELVDRLMEAGVESWHTVTNDEPSLSSWLGLTDAEYAAWVEGRGERLAWQEAVAALDQEEER